MQQGVRVARVLLRPVAPVVAVPGDRHRTHSKPLTAACRSMYSGCSRPDRRQAGGRTHNQSFRKMPKSLLPRL